MTVRINEHLAEMLRLLANFVAQNISVEEFLIGMRHQCDKLERGE